MRVGLMEIDGGNEGDEGDEGGRNPVGVGREIWRWSQGSGVAATLGYGTESRWDSGEGSCPKDVLE